MAPTLVLLRIPPPSSKSPNLSWLLQRPAQDEREPHPSGDSGQVLLDLKGTCRILSGPTLEHGLKLKEAALGRNIIDFTNKETRH